MRYGFLGWAVCAAAVAVDVQAQSLLPQPFSSTSVFFGPTDDPSVGQTLTGDVNGDGLDDVVVRTRDLHVLVLLGASDGVLAPPSSGPTFTTHDETDLVSVAARLTDVNGDGRDDLVAAGKFMGSNRAFVQLGQADGSFGDVIDTALPLASIGGFALIDDDGDGRDDLWFVESLGSRVARMASTGDGSFTASQFFVAAPNGVKQLDLDVGDVNGDGELDAVVHTTDNVVSIALGNGVDFDAPVTLTAVGLAWRETVGLADVTGDGVLDVVLRDVQDEQRITVLPGGSELLTSSPLHVDASFPVSSWAVEDLDENGVPDLLLTGEVRTAVFFQHGNTFDAPVFTAGRVRGLPLADIDLDGRLDLIRSADRGVRVLHGERNGTFGREITRRQAFELAAGHLDDDGMLDVVSADFAALSSGSRINVRLSDGFSGWGSPNVFPITARSQAVAIGPVDANGDNGVVFVTDDEITTLLYNGSASFTKVRLPGVDARRGAEIVDVTGDGVLDVVSIAADLSATLFMGLGDGAFVPSALGASAGGLSVSTSGDIDGDGVDEVITATSGIEVIDAAGVVAIAGDAVLHANAVALIDVDRDGDLDLALSRGPTDVEIWANDAGSFTLKAIIPMTYSVHGLTACDVDLDGHDDLVASERSLVDAESLLSVWLFEEAGGLSLGAATPVGDFIGRVWSFDIDGDGADDVMVEGSNEAMPYLNRAGGWINLGESLAGSSGRSGLDGFGALTSGGDIALVIDRSLPFANTSLVLGFSELSAPFAGGTLVPNPDVIMSGLVTDAAGELQIAATLPRGIPSGIELFFQAWQPDPAGGFSATTALLGTTR